MSDTIEITQRAFRPAEFRAGSLDVANRTIEIVWSSGAPVRRYDWSAGEFYLEKLEMTAEACDLERMNSGVVSFLDNHRREGMADRLGSIIPGTAKIEAGLGIATVKLSTSGAGSRILADLEAGLSLPVSVGYSIAEYSRDEGDDDAVPTVTATRWTPLEVSAVLIPADPVAQARAEPEGHHITIPVTMRRAKGAAAKEPAMTTTDDTLDRAAIDTEIRQIGENHDASARLVRKAIDSKKTVAEFREMILDARRAEQEKTQIFTIAPLPYQERGHASLVDAMADAIQARVDRSYKPSDTGSALVGLSMPELARRALEARGEGTRGASAGELVTRALHSSSDFPIALSAVANRLVRKGYEATPSAIQTVARQVSAKDFKPRAGIFLASKGGLEKVNEHGEFKRGTFVEGAELYAIETYGKIFGLTRQALINDDLSLFDRLPQELGQKAKNFEADFLTKLVEGTAKMSDGLVVFHASHGNLAAAGTALSVTSLAAGRLALRKQRSPDGELAGLAPKYLIVPPELELLGEQVLTVINAEKPSDVNPFSGQLQLLVEPRLANSQAWYLAARPDQSGLEFAYLEGAEGPQIDTRNGFDIDGTEWKVRLDFGGGWQDFRGFWKNPGVAP